MKRTVSVLAAVCILAAVASAQNRGFNWDSGPSSRLTIAIPPQTYGDGDANNIAEPDANFPATHVLKVYNRHVPGSTSTATPEVYLVHVNGLLEGEQVTVSCNFRMLTSGTNDKVRLWSAYTRNWPHGDANTPTNFDDCTPYSFNYAGSSGGPTTYVSNKTAWETQSYTWTFAAGTAPFRQGIIFSVRSYGATNGAGVADNLVVTCPDHCTVTFPDGTNGYDATPPAVCTTPLFGDLNYDCQVNMKDVGVVGTNWLINDTNDLSGEFPSGVQNMGYGWQDMDNVGANDPNALITIENAAGTAKYWSNGYPTFGVVADPCHDTPYALQCTQGSVGNGELYIAKIDGLVNGDKVAASIWLKSGPASGKLRLWAFYTVPLPTHFAGAAGGDDAYSQSDWKRFSHEWTFEAGTTPVRTGMIIELRAYGPYQAIAGYADDIVISAPTHATITFPKGNPGSATTQAPVCVTRPVGDLNVDCNVNMADFAIVATDWLKCGWNFPVYCQ